MANGWEKHGDSDIFCFLGLQNHCGCECNHKIKRCLLSGSSVQSLSHVQLFATPWAAAHVRRKAVTNLDNILESRDIYLLTNVHVVKAMFFLAVMCGCELDRKDSWVPTSWFLQTLVLEKTYESPLDRKEIKPVCPKGNRPWVFIGRTDAEAEALILSPPDGKNKLLWKDLDNGKNWGQEKKQATEDEISGRHYSLSGYEFEQIQGDSEEQGSLVCCTL